MPYLYSKNATKPDPCFIEEPIDIPVPTNIAEAFSNITVIQGHYASGRIGGMTHDRLMAGTRAFIDGVATGSSTADQVIRIEGGLPSLPGTNVTMPDLSLPAPAEEAKAE
jgi:hypothetical protein